MHHSSLRNIHLLWHGHPSWAAVWISVPPWSSPWATCFTGDLSRHGMGISAPVPGAPPPTLSSLTLVSAGLLLILFSLSYFTDLCWFCSFLNTNFWRCCLCGQVARPCPVVGRMESSGTGHVQPRAVLASHHRPPQLPPRPGHRQPVQ